MSVLRKISGVLVSTSGLWTSNEQEGLLFVFQDFGSLLAKNPLLIS